MPIEDASYISELDSNNPAEGDPAGSGDDHIRTLKKALKNSFPNIAGEVSLTHEEINALPQSILDAVSATINFMLPHTEQKYSIKPWSTVMAPIPEGWQLMDGTDGIPDLRGLFIVGAGSGYNVGDTSNIKEKTTSESGEHDHEGETEGHALTVDEMPEHDHEGKSFWSTTKDEGSSVGPDYDPSDKDGVEASIEPEGGGQEHKHGIEKDGKHTHTVDVTPPYYALAWIIKTSEITSDDIADLLTELSGEEEDDDS